MLTASPRTVRGATSAKKVGQTTGKAPTPRPAMKRPPKVCPTLPFEVIQMAVPRIQTRQLTCTVLRRPILSARIKASNDPSLRLSRCHISKTHDVPGIQPS